LKRKRLKTGKKTRAFSRIRVGLTGLPCFFMPSIEGTKILYILLFSKFLGILHHPSSGCTPLACYCCGAIIFFSPKIEPLNCSAIIASRASWNLEHILSFSLLFDNLRLKGF
jgi:hypothetical protein